MKKSILTRGSLSRELIIHGGHCENDNRMILNAGRLSMTYERGSLRHITSGGHELVRMIYVAVRDSAWLTVTPVISDEKKEIYPGSFRITYTASYFSGDIRYVAEMTLEGREDSTVCFSMNGEAMNTFMKNRIGFCVLHPAGELSGKDCIIGSEDGSFRIETFPEMISPHQPFNDISLMQWNNHGISCRLSFAGEVFETEDQRNWTDASFKTYCTPLRLPFPAKVHKGDKHTQSVTFKISGEASEKSAPDMTPEITIHPELLSSMPGIGISRASYRQIDAEEASLIRKVGFSHYRGEIHLFSTGWETEASTASEESKMMGLPLELALFFSQRYREECESFNRWMSSVKPDIRVISIFHKDYDHTPALIAGELLPLLRRKGIMIAAGTNGNFAQLNRNRSAAESADLVCFSIHPQEHASDNMTLIENLEAQAHAALSAKAFSGNKGIWASPVTIQRRFNSNTSNYETAYDSETIPPQVDSRMMSLFGASWTAGSLKYLAGAGVHGITFYETVGERGLMMGKNASRWMPEFQAYENMIFPVYHLFRFICPMTSAIKCTSAQPLKAEILAATNGSVTRLVIMSFSDSDEEVQLTGLAGKARMYVLDERSFSTAAADPDWTEKVDSTEILLSDKIKLNQYSLSFIEI